MLLKTLATGPIILVPDPSVLKKLFEFEVLLFEQLSNQTAFAKLPKLQFAFTVTVTWAVVAHWPGVGVNVYVFVSVLLTTGGDQVPVIPLISEVGKTGAGVPTQIGDWILNNGKIVGGSMVIFIW